jgi:hypothetical protein
VGFSGVDRKSDVNMSSGEYTLILTAEALPNIAYLDFDIWSEALSDFPR